VWILVGGRTRVKRIPDGRSLRRHCDTCEEVTEWAECLVLDRVEVFSISLLDTKSRCLVCMECGEDVDPADVPLSPPRKRIEPPATPPAPPRWSERDTSRDVAPVAPHRVGPHHPEIDEELAAMKRRLGKR
jgi:hypothetical protein